MAMLVLSTVFKTNYSHGICSALYAPIKRSARTRPAVLKHRSSTHTQKKEKKINRGVWVMSLRLAGEELLRERMSEARAPRLPCTVEKSVHALRGMFYLNRTLSITVPNLNSLARKKEKRKRKRHADVLLYFCSKLYVVTFPTGSGKHYTHRHSELYYTVNCVQTH